MNHLDPVNTAIVFASIVFGPALAALIGPYSVIVIASAVGAAWSLRRRETLSHLDTIAYFTLIIFTAILVTVSAASTVANWLSMPEGTWLLSPIALVIGGVGADWPRLIKWCFTRWFKHRTGGNTND